MHAVQARMRREFDPCFTRTRWMLGSQRLLDRLCEKLTCFPTHGPLPQMSQRFDTGGALRVGAGEIVAATGEHGESAVRGTVPPMPLTAAGLKSAMQRYHDRLRRHRDDIDRLNVYPVPDGDTGTNMSLTVASVMAAADGARTMAELAQALAQGSLLGARGNSGVILSQIFRGIADVVRRSEALDVAELAEALERASDAAYRAVMRPQEGTILTVLREAAAAARDAASAAGADLAGFLQAVYRRGVASLERTPELLPVLRDAGVVDAGGAGFLLLLAALAEEVTGRQVDLPPAVFAAAARRPAPEATAPATTVSPRYEVMFLLDAADAAVDAMRSAWAAIGDSIVVVGGDGTWNCHIHTDDIGAAVEAGVEAGRPRQIRVTDLAEQVAAEAYHAPPPFTPLPEAAAAPVGVVAVAAGDGVVDLFRGFGAQGLVVGGQTMNPALADLAAAVEAAAASEVIVLPNNKNVVPVAERVGEAVGKRVLVVPTRSIGQGLAAMVAYRTNVADAAALAAAMAAATRDVRSGEVTAAVRDAATPIGLVRSGDWLGIADGQVVAAEPALGGALTALLAVLVTADAELVTVLTGGGAEAAATKAAAAWLDEHHPAVELEVLDGGQPVYAYLVSVE